MKEIIKRITDFLLFTIVIFVFSALAGSVVSCAVLLIGWAIGLLININGFLAVFIIFSILFFLVMVVEIQKNKMNKEDVKELRIEPVGKTDKLGE